MGFCTCLFCTSYSVVTSQTAPITPDVLSFLYSLILPNSFRTFAGNLSMTMDNFSTEDVARSRQPAVKAGVYHEIPSMQADGTNSL